MKRTPYFQHLMTSTYPSLPIEAVQNGFTGAWERLIAAQLQKDFVKGHSEAEVLLQSMADSVEPLRNICLKAAYLITSSKIEPCHT